MSDDVEARAEEIPILDLDPAEIGRALVRAIASACHARHEGLRDSIRIYGHPTRPEAVFVRDVLVNGSAPDLARRWLGGEFEARVAAALVVAEHFGYGDDSNSSPLARYLSGEAET